MQLSHEMGVLPNPSSAYTATKFGLMNDMLHILYGNISVAKTLAQDLRTLKIGIGPGPLCNSSIHIYCVDIKMLQQLVAVTRERLLQGEYQRIYPVADGERYSRFIRHMDNLVHRKLEKAYNARTLWQIHHLLTALEKLNRK